MRHIFSILFLFVSFCAFSNTLPKANITKANYFEIISTSPITNTVTVSFTSTGTTTWTVPERVYSISVVVIGGGGGQATNSGGNGGKVSATLNVTPGQVLDLVIGGGGLASQGWGGGGGGASSINAGTANQIIAGGGGGSALIGGGGGNGGNPNGANGVSGGGGGGIGGSGGIGGAEGTPSVEIGGGGGNGNGGAGGGGALGGYGSGLGVGGNNHGWSGYGGGGYGGGGGGGNSSSSDGGGGGGGSIGPAGSTYSVGTNANGGNGSIVINYLPTPTLNITSPLNSLTACLGFNSSASTSFGVTGSFLIENITVSAPTNFVIAISPSGTYSSTLVIDGSSGTVSSTLYAKLSSSATAGAKTGTITATSSGATAVTTTVSGTVNICGITSQGKMEPVSTSTSILNSSGEVNNGIGINETGKILYITATNQINIIENPSNGGGLVLNLDARNLNSLSRSASPGTWYDLTSNHNDATINGSLAYGPGYGGALNFPGGDNDYAQAKEGVYFDGSFTIQSWVYPTSVPNWNRIIDFGRGQGVNNILLSCTFGTSGRPGLHIEGAEFMADSTLTLNAWNNVCATYNSITGVAKIYVNGKPSGNRSMPTPVNIKREKCYIGRSNWGIPPNPDPNFVGGIGAIQIYNMWLTDAEILSNYNSTKSLYGL